MPLASGVRACRFELHSHAGRGVRKMPGYPVDDSWFMLGDQVRFRRSRCVQDGAGLLASLLEPVSPPTVGVRTNDQSVACSSSLGHPYS